MKKTIIFTLILSMVLSFSAFAADTAATDSELEKILIDVKMQVYIPQEYTEFDYYTNAENCYSFNWNTEDGKKAIVIEYENGIITSYDCRENGYYGRSKQAFKKLAAFTKEEAQTAAVKFASRIVDNYSDYRMYQCDTYDNSFEFYFLYYKNGVPVKDATYSVEVDYSSGEVVRFQNYPPVYDVYSGDPSKPALTASAAQEVLKTVQKEMLAYNIDYNYDEEAIEKTFAAYSVEMNELDVVNAETGKVIKMDSEDDGYYGSRYYDSYGFNSYAGRYGGMGMAADELTEEELAAAEKFAKLLTCEEAQKIIADSLPAQFDKNLKLTEQGLHKKYMDDEDFLWTLGFEFEDEEHAMWFEAQVDALTGEILSFTAMDMDEGYFDSMQEQFAPDKNKILTAAAEMMAKLNKSNDVTFKLDPNFTEGTERFTYVTYFRYENDIPVLDDAISVFYDNKTNSVIGYNKNLTKGLVFDKFTAAGRDAVLKEYAALHPVEMDYVCADKKYQLVYIPLGVAYSSELFDAVTAKQVDYSGEPIEKPQEEQAASLEYTDISGHFAQKQITALANIGIGLEGPEYKPDQTITAAELLNLLLKCKDDYYYGGYDGQMSKEQTDLVKESAVEQGLIAEKEIADMSAPVTRELAAEIFVRAIGYKKIAAVKEIYTQPFDDVDTSCENFGAICILKGLKIVGGGDGSFYPKKQVSRGEAAIMIYNLLREENTAE